MDGERRVQVRQKRRLAAYAAWAIFGVALFSSAAPTFAQSSRQTAAQAITLELNADQSKVHFTVDTTLHTVHGTFALKKGSVLHFDPETSKASGEIAVDTTTGESGDSGRDKRMHKEILETARYPDAIFHPRQIEGQVARNGASDVKIQGVITLHGTEHEVVALVNAELTGDHWTATAKFDVPYVQWGIKDASNWLLKVKPVVNIEIDMTGSISNGK
jgi:polyisoprenoid-binding protein YceI